MQEPQSWPVMARYLRFRPEISADFAPTQVPQCPLRDAGRRIERTFKFENFAEAFAFTKRVGDLAEAEGH
jgi:pterin-4a-carbinolamine dehydratase